MTSKARRALVVSMATREACALAGHHHADTIPCGCPCHGFLHTLWRKITGAGEISHPAREPEIKSVADFQFCYKCGFQHRPIDSPPGICCVCGERPGTLPYGWCATCTQAAREEPSQDENTRDKPDAA